MLNRLVKTNEDYALTIARLVLGMLFFIHGEQLMLGWFGGYGLSGSMKFFTEQLGIPAPFAFLAICAEFFGGLMLIAGFLGRVAALTIICTHGGSRRQGALAVRGFHELVWHTERRRVRISLAGYHHWGGSRFTRFGRSFTRPAAGPIARKRAGGNGPREHRCSRRDIAILEQFDQRRILFTAG